MREKFLRMDRRIMADKIDEPLPRVFLPHAICGRQSDKGQRRNAQNYFPLMRSIDPEEEMPKAERKKIQDHDRVAEP